MAATGKSAYARGKERRERDLFWEYRLHPHARLMELARGANSLQSRAAGRILANRGSAAAFRDAVKLCREPEPVLRGRGAWLLGNLRLPDTDKGRQRAQRALALLRELAANDQRGRVRAEARRGLERRAALAAEVAKEAEYGNSDAPRQSAYARRKDSEQLLLWHEMKRLPHARLVECLGDPDALKRYAARGELQIRNSRGALRDGLRLCRNENPVLREEAALLLGQLNFPDSAAGRESCARVSAALHKLAVGDPRAAVRSGALFALGHHASRGGDHALVLHAAQSGARDRSRNVRYATAFALGGINLPGAEKILLPLLRDPDKDVRDWAAFAVFRQEGQARIVYDTPEIRDALLELARDADWEIRYEALRALGLLGERRAAPLLARELDNDRILYFDLARAAGQTGDPALIPVLEKALERFDDDTEFGGDKGIIATALERLRGNK